jgi:2-polyprenyl-6-methoxyphenol hydroxylase-like FAD-dependent oxidoreductase
MLIAADGAPSRLARLAGIDVQERRISTVIGYRIGMQSLSQPEYGHVYLGAASPILVYPIGHGQARVLFDIPYELGRSATAEDCLVLSAAMPATLRDETAKAIATQRGMSFSARAITPDSVVQGGVVLVGDAGGSCHPLTATGMTMCISDALLLGRALASRSDDLTAALRLYEQRRRWPQATRLLLADALRDAFLGASPEMRVVRSGILSHWQTSATGRVATLALLSTADGRPLTLLRQITTIMIRGLIAHLRGSASEENVTTARVAKTLVGNLLGHIRQVLRGSRTPKRALAD